MKSLNIKEVILVINIILIKTHLCIESEQDIMDAWISDQDIESSMESAELCGYGNRRMGFKNTWFEKHPNNINETLISELSKMNIQEFITYYGYPVETHKVTTADGYILQLHRIPHGRKVFMDTRNKTRPVVYLLHGFMSSSHTFVISGPEKGLAFILADAGYDVWMGNVRGNLYSRQHIYLDPDVQDTFWDFTFHEVGVYDLPACIDYILTGTNQKKLFYIGYSQGNTAYYIMLSEIPSYNDKIYIQFSLAPIAYISNLSGIAPKLFHYFNYLFQLQSNMHQLHELNADLVIFKWFKKHCLLKKWREICIANIFTLTGTDYQQFNQSLLPFIVEHLPAGSSTKQYRHTTQLLLSGEFQQFDFGAGTNLKIYGTYMPPKYNLNNILAPIYLIYSHNDYLSRPSDVIRLYSEIPKGNKYLWSIPNKQWNHMDFTMGIDAKTVIYDLLIRIMKNFHER